MIPWNKGQCKRKGCDGCTPDNCPGAGNCRPYVRAHVKEWHAHNKDKVDDYNNSNKDRKWAQNTLKDHRRKGYTTECSIDYVIGLIKDTNMICPICGVEMKFNGVCSNDSLTLDDVDNSHCLREGNCMVMCHLCNTTKGPRDLKTWKKDLLNTLKALERLGV